MDIIDLENVDNYAYSYQTRTVQQNEDDLNPE